MVDFILVIILIIVLFMVYKQMSCFDELIESIEYPTILIIYDDQYQIAKKYENDTIKCIPKKYITLNKVINMSFYAVKMIIITY